MVRGDENLRFTDAEIGGAEPTAHPVRRRREPPQRPPDDLPPALYGAILIGLMCVLPLTIGLSEYAERRSSPKPAPHAIVEHQAEPSGIRATVHKPGPQATRGREQQRPMPDTRASAGAEADVHIWSLKGLDGETYTIASRPGELPSAPPGFRAAYAFAGTPFYDAPKGNLVGRLVRTTPVLHTLAVSLEPCWRWSATADGTLSGYVCFLMPGDLPPPPALDIAQPREVLPEAVASHLPAASAPRWPRQFACADASGRFQRITDGPFERQALYEVPLCDEFAEPKRAYTFEEVTTLPQLLHKVAPEYTEAARIARFEGTVFLHVLIDEHGTPTAFRVMQSLGLGLDENAITAVRCWSFRPAYRGDTPVPMWVPVEVNYRMLSSSE